MSALYFLGFFSVFILYRIHYYQSIIEAFAFLPRLSWFEYFWLWLPHDLGVSLFCSILLWSLHKLIKANKTILLMSIFCLVAFALYFSFYHNIFQIYESSFSLSMIDQLGKDSWKEVILSGWHEISKRSKTMLIQMLIAIMTTMLILSAYSISKYRFHRSGKQLNQRITISFKILGISWLSAQVSILMTITGLFYAKPGFWIESLQAMKPERYSLLSQLYHAKGFKASGNKDLPLTISHSELQAFARANIFFNPISIFFLQDDNIAKGVNAPDTSENDHKNNFRFGYDTQSLTSRKIYPRISAIERGQKYNIILYFFESTPSQYLGHRINGQSVTPTWDRLRRHSFIAEKHYANYPLSVNALYTVLSSSYELPSKKWITQVRPQIQTQSLSEILHKNGYRTGLAHPGNLGYAWQRKYLRHRKFDRIIDYDQLKDDSEYRPLDGVSAEERAMIKPSVKFMKEDSEKPFFFVFLPYYPHHPYKIPSNDFRITGPIPGNIHWKQRNWMRYLNSLYFADAVLGQLLAELAQAKLLDNTLVFVFADHGEAFYQHPGNYNHPLYLYEENVHVPFVIYNEIFFPQPLVYDGISRHIDIMPTVLDILNIAKPYHAEGVSLFSSHKKQFAPMHTHWQDELVALRDANWKYIKRLNDGYEELYNLDHDPHEKSNIIQLHPEISSRYRKKLIDLRQYKREYYFRLFNKYPEEY